MTTRRVSPPLPHPHASELHPRLPEISPPRRAPACRRARARTIASPAQRARGMVRWEGVAGSGSPTYHWLDWRVRSWLSWPSSVVSAYRGHAVPVTHGAAEVGPIHWQPRLLPAYVRAGGRVSCRSAHKDGRVRAVSGVCARWKAGVCLGGLSLAPGPRDTGRCGEMWGDIPHLALPPSRRPIDASRSMWDCWLETGCCSG